MKVIISLLLATVALSHVSTTPASVVNSALLKAYSTKDHADIMIVLKAKTSQVLAQVESQIFATTDDKATTLYNELNRFTSSSQKEILSILTKFKSSGVKGFYITNRISVRGAPLELVQALAHRDDIEEIREAKVVHIEAPVEVSQERVLEWGVSQINAPEAWERGYTGAGIVSSNIDTGVRYTHVALRDGYRADYGWFDPEGNTELPNDQNAHGTHTMGSIVGRNGTGVASESMWVACKGCSTSACSEYALISCGEWTFCPTNWDGTGSDCTKRPNLSSNSWGGGQEDAWYDEVINSWNSVNIIPIFALGNSGPGCRTANSPGDRPNVISVGATNADDAVAVFSSHGPTLATSVIKPEVSAPGVNIRSCGIATDTSYTLLSGTSMATPHVAGAVAILLQAGLATRPEIATALETTTVRPEIPEIVCTGGGVNITYPWPNNSYGWGRIDVSAALNSVLP
ncbi:bacillopeptidase F [Folsomia candida]|uniref:Bacillopeptidase F n=1 Tax=Folsomia candida TaxID=158441 RepID=A0A226ELL6_FOLCA|nr:bacillopeptidase F [Folsomia candida]OXA58027.1 Bacillopeptidase F [Folsomia candida]